MSDRLASTFRSEVGKHSELSKLKAIDPAALYQEWYLAKNGYFQQGVTLASFPTGLHGINHIGDTQCVGLNRNDPPERRLEALIHERLHEPDPVATSREPAHTKLRQLARKLNTVIFPQQEQKMPRASELYLTDDERAMKAQIDVIHAAKRMRALLGAQRPTLLSPEEQTVPAVREAEPEVEARIRGKWRGWAVDSLIKLYYANVFLWPIRGLVHAEPLHDINGWKASGLEAWWQQIISTLDTGATRTTKSYGRTAVAGGAAATAAVTTSAIGLVVTLSDAILSDNNAPFEVEHFTPGQQMDYMFEGDFARQGAVSYLILHATLDRGAGVPTRRDDLNARTIAAQRRDASVILARSLNYRDLQ
jgi:hypothetical protein